MRALLDRASRYRYALLGVVGVAIWLDTYGVVEGEGTDWHYFVAGARALTGPAGLHVFAQMPYLQFGPLALLVPVLLRAIGPHQGWAVVSLLDMTLGVLAIGLLERAALMLDVEARQASAVVLLGGPCVLAAWASPGVSEGHPDDVLALLAIAAAVWAMASGRWPLAAVLLGLASAAKPWSLLLLPLAAAYPGRRVRGLGLTLITAGLPWLPFLIVDPSTTKLARFHLGVEAASTLHYLGMAAGTQPAWPRYAQLALALVLGGLAVARGRWVLVPLIAFAVRINLDPAAVDYYAAGPVVGALMWDVAAPSRIPGLRAILTWFALLYFPSDLLTLGARGTLFEATVVALRLAVLLVALAVVARGGATTRALTPAAT